MPLSSPRARVWYELEQPDVDFLPDADFDRLTQQVDRVLDAYLPFWPPELQQAARRSLWLIDSHPDRVSAQRGLAYVSTSEGEIAVAILASTVEAFNTSQLAYTLAHELTHIALEHIQPLRDEHLGSWRSFDECAIRMYLRATEPLVRDTLDHHGILLVDGVSDMLWSGQEMFGFRLTGLNRSHIWACLNGDMHVHELNALAQSRRHQGIIFGDDADWQDQVESPCAEAKVFWQDRVGPWQQSWTTIHQQMVETKRGVTQT